MAMTDCHPTRLQLGLATESKEALAGRTNHERLVIPLIWAHF